MKLNKEDLALAREKSRAWIPIFAIVIVGLAVYISTLPLGEVEGVTAKQVQEYLDGADATDGEPPPLGLSAGFDPREFSSKVVYLLSTVGFLFATLFFFPCCIAFVIQRIRGAASVGACVVAALVATSAGFALVNKGHLWFETMVRVGKDASWSVPDKPLGLDMSIADFFGLVLLANAAALLAASCCMSQPLSEAPRDFPDLLRVVKRRSRDIKRITLGACVVFSLATVTHFYFYQWLYAHIFGLSSRGQAVSTEQLSLANTVPYGFLVGIFLTVCWAVPAWSLRHDVDVALGQLESGVGTEKGEAIQKVRDQVATELKALPGFFGAIAPVAALPLTAIVAAVL